MDNFYLDGHVSNISKGYLGGEIFSWLTC